MPRKGQCDRAGCCLSACLSGVPIPGGTGARATTPTLNHRSEHGVFDLIDVDHAGPVRSRRCPEGEGSSSQSDPCAATLNSLHWTGFVVWPFSWSWVSTPPPDRWSTFSSG